MTVATPRLVGARQRFAIRRRLGTGEFADVFEAIDRHSQQRVALKLVRSRRRNAPDRQSLQSEFDKLRRVQHPNVARCHELFLGDQEAFFTMELVEGTGFVEYVRADVRRTVPTSDFVPCGATGIARLRRTLPQLAGGIDALHAAGLVHRDLHPGNVRVTFGGRIVVIDYGLATERDNADERDRSAAFIGNSRYAAPEQPEQGREPASDWYSLGVLLFEALTGAVPFAGNDHEVFVRKRTLSAPIASSLVPSVPADLDRLCTALLDPDPKRRPAAREILTRLETPP